MSKPTLTEMFVAAYEPDSSSEFPSSEEMDTGFKQARKELATELGHKRRRELLVRMQALTNEIQNVSFEVEELENRLSPKGDRLVKDD